MQTNLKIKSYSDYLTGKYWKNKPINNKSGYKHITAKHSWILNKETGIEEWKETEKIDLDLVIQANSKDTDMATIARQILNGNTSILNAKQGIYCDTALLPQNIHEAHAMAETLANLYSENKLLQKIYPTKELYQASFIAGKVPQEIDKFKIKEQERIAKHFEEMRKQQAKNAQAFDELKATFKKENK